MDYLALNRNEILIHIPTQWSDSIFSFGSFEFPCTPYGSMSCSYKQTSSMHFMELPALLLVSKFLLSPEDIIQYLCLLTWVNSRLLVIKFWGIQQFYVDFQLFRVGWVSISLTSHCSGASHNYQPTKKAPKNIYTQTHSPPSVISQTLLDTRENGACVQSIKVSFLEHKVGWRRVK